MTPQNNPQQQKQHGWPLRRAIMGGLFILVSAAYIIFALFSRGPTTEDVSLPAIVSAIEAGQVENLRVQGDALVATKTDGARLSSRKEAGISAIESLQILGASPEALKTLPMMVENPNFSFGSLFSLLLTFGPLLFVGFIFFRFLRQLQGGGDMMGRIGRSNPRVLSGAAAKGEMTYPRFDGHQVKRQSGFHEKFGLKQIKACTAPPTIGGAVLCLKNLMIAGWQS